MLINQLLLINRTPSNIFLAQNLNTRLDELLTDHILSGLGVGVGFDEDKGGVFEGAAAVGAGGALLGEDGGTGGAGKH